MCSAPDVSIKRLEVFSTLAVQVLCKPSLPTGGFAFEGTLQRDGLQGQRACQAKYNLAVDQNNMCTMCQWPWHGVGKDGYAKCGQFEMQTKYAVVCTQTKQRVEV